MPFLQRSIQVLVQVLDGTWAVSMGIMPFLLIAFPVAYIYLVDADIATSVFEAYRALTLRYGLYVLTGALVAGAAGRLLGLSTTPLQVVGGAVVAGFVLYAVREEGIVLVEYPDASGWRRWLPYAWFGVFVVALAAVLTFRPVLQSITAVAFYSYVFWRL